MQSLKGRTAIVTGGALGIGRGMAAVLAREGATVVLADVDLPRAEASAAALREARGEVVAIATDVTDEASVKSMVAETVSRYGAIDILLSNAGIYPLIRIADLDDEKWDRVMGLNVKGTLRVIRACLPHMIERHYGRIVVSSSITGPLTGTPGYAAYGASKAALLGMMRSLALEVATKGVTINALLPGNVRTEGLLAMSDEHQRQMLSSIPMGYFADPEDIGWAARFLVSEEARYITGQTLVIDGGQVLPEASDSIAHE